ncbi:electron transport complex subunit RsxD [Alteromonas sp. ASW11-130]|uniref:electron transport complex subunit RsxD n=1 Tax=Alteromonas sp. ASW11-130 TaxID=3015775 RepID=UPI002242009A|nr:electron transport complex subunit RsxD [Alteromonas sp. ASW11-130]MCW8093077.1 electron transport complex subunit RsxD [Alteromonas sp. ASW11-130]
MKLTLSSSPHQRVRRDTSQVMRLVILAMIPGIMAQVIIFGFGVLIQATIAVITAVITEAAILQIRGRSAKFALNDFSAVLTALLLAVSIPPLLPWWMTILGTFFAIAVVKQLYGGLGFNLFNPAMAGYVMLLISFPAAMTLWLPPQSLASIQPDFVNVLTIIMTGFTESGHSMDQLRMAADGITMATPLDSVKTALSQNYTYPEALDEAIFTNNLNASAGAGWAWVSLAYLVGGLFLVKINVINWHIPTAMLAAAALLSAVFYIADSDSFASPIFHLLNGSLLFGAFFIATDPVTASTTDKGRLVFGAFIGMWVIVIRTFGGYPDAVAFAVIVMNMAVPLIDYYTRPRTYGHTAKRARKP